MGTIKAKLKTTGGKIIAVLIAILFVLLGFTVNGANASTISWKTPSDAGEWPADVKPIVKDEGGIIIDKPLCISNATIAKTVKSGDAISDIGRTTVSDNFSDYGYNGWPCVRATGLTLSAGSSVTLTSSFSMTWSDVAHDAHGNRLNMKVTCSNIHIKAKYSMSNASIILALSRDSSSSAKYFYSWCACNNSSTHKFPFGVAMTYSYEFTKVGGGSTSDKVLWYFTDIDQPDETLDASLGNATRYQGTFTEAIKIYGSHGDYAYKPKGGTLKIETDGNTHRFYATESCNTPGSMEAGFAIQMNSSGMVRTVISGAAMTAVFHTFGNIDMSIQCESGGNIISSATSINYHDNSDYVKESIGWRNSVTYNVKAKPYYYISHLFIDKKNPAIYPTTAQQLEWNYEFNTVTESRAIHAYFGKVQGTVNVSKLDASTPDGSTQGNATRNGTTFTIKCVDSPFYTNGTDIKTITTDVNGNGSLTLDGGEFTIRETSASTGYLNNNTAEQTFKIDTNGKVVSYTFKNNVMKGNIKVEKQDIESGSSAQGAATLQGAQFDIYNKSTNPVYVNSKSVAKDGLVMTLTTGNNGQAESGQVLPYGQYLVQEKTAPTGYLKDSTSQTVTISSDGQVINLNGDNSFKNTVIQGSLVLQKQDTITGAQNQGAATFEGATFEIKNLNNNNVLVDGKSFAKDSVCKTLVTDENGYASMGTDLPYGKYSIRETTAPGGYLNSNSATKEFTISTDGQVINYTGDNSFKDEVIKGRLDVQMLDDLTRQDPQGDSVYVDNQYTIINESPNPVYVDGALHQPGEVVKVIKTDDLGNTTSGDVLPYGSYVVKETKTSEGYNPEEQEKVFTIVNHGEVVFYTHDDSFENPVQRGGLKFQKLDADASTITQGDATLQGAEFKVYNVSENAVRVNDVEYPTYKDTKQTPTGLWGNMNNIGEYNIDKSTAIPVSVLYTDSSGRASLSTDTLPYGTYVIAETAPPTGYLINDELAAGVTFTIRSDGDLASFVNL